MTGFGWFYLGLGVGWFGGASVAYLFFRLASVSDASASPLSTARRRRPTVRPGPESDDSSMLSDAPQATHGGPGRTF